MSYITQVELEALFPGAFASVTDALWAQVIPGVDQLIDGYLAARFTVPVVPVPALLRELATDIARYQLEDALIYDIDKDAGLKARYDYALKQLQALANGTLALPGAPLATVTGLGLPVFETGPSLFAPGDF